MQVSSSWQKRRADINHDWLQNSYRRALGAWLKILGGSKDAHFERTFIQEVLPQWETHREETKSLIESFEVDMSPKVLFDKPPLAKCPEPQKDLLKNLIHRLWKFRYDIHTTIQNALDRFLDVDESYRLLQGKLSLYSDGISDELRQTLLPEFQNFSQNCEALGKALGEFPREILVSSRK